MPGPRSKTRSRRDTVCKGLIFMAQFTIFPTNRGARATNFGSPVAGGCQPTYSGAPGLSPLRPASGRGAAHLRLHGALRRPGCGGGPPRHRLLQGARPEDGRVHGRSPGSPAAHRSGLAPRELHGVTEGPEVLGEALAVITLDLDRPVLERAPRAADPLHLGDAGVEGGPALG